MSAAVIDGNTYAELFGGTREEIVTWLQEHPKLGDLDLYAVVGDGVPMQIYSVRGYLADFS